MPRLPSCRLHQWRSLQEVSLRRGPSPPGSGAREDSDIAGDEQTFPLSLVVALFLNGCGIREGPEPPRSPPAQGCLGSADERRQAGTGWKERLHAGLTVVELEVDGTHERNGTDGGGTIPLAPWPTSEGPCNRNPQAQPSR